MVVKLIRRYIRCCIQLSFPSVQEHEEESVVHDLTPAAVDAHVVLPLPSTIFQFRHHHHHHQPSNVKVHIAPISEIPSSIALSPSGLPPLFPGVEEQDEMDTFDALARTTLPRPMDTIDPGSRTSTPPRRRSSIQEHFVALRVSGNELVDGLRTSSKARESGHQRSSFSQDGQIALHTEESPQIDHPSHGSRPQHRLLLPPLGEKHLDKK